MLLLPNRFCSYSEFLHIFVYFLCYFPFGMRRSKVLWPSLGFCVQLSSPHHLYTYRYVYMYLLFTFARTSFLILLNFWYGTCNFFLFLFEVVLLWEETQRVYFYYWFIFNFLLLLFRSFFLLFFLHKFSEKNKKALSNASALSAIWRVYASFKDFIIVC